MRLGAELEAATTSLATGLDKACASLAMDLEPMPIPPGAPTCEVALRRLVAFRERLSTSGLRLLVSVKGVRCTTPKSLVEECAGECVTGMTGVVSRVECQTIASAGPPTCSGDLALPNAPPACLARCRARALTALSCAADVDVRLEGGSADDPSLATVVERLRASVPPLVGFATEAASRVVEISRTVPPLVDDLGASVDAMTSAPKADRRLAVGAALATCFAPALARTVKASARLGTSIDGARQLGAKLSSP